MAAYYNEIDGEAAATLRELMRRGVIAPGDVDTRSIEDVRPDDVRSYTQCHFFAGEGVWSYALRLAGWPDNRRVWTASCPCQPFSEAGKGAGFADERHLWPSLFHIIQHGKCREIPLFGEQVASADGLAWIDVVCSDMEAEAHAIWAFDFCAAGVGAPHIRQRFYFVADTQCCGGGQYMRTEVAQRPLSETVRKKGASCIRSGRKIRSLGNSNGTRHEKRARFKRYDGAPDKTTEWEALVEAGLVRGFWSDAEWIECREPKGTYYRPIEPGTFPLASGATARVLRLRLHGNAINAQVAAEFIKAAAEAIG